MSFRDVLRSWPVYRQLSGSDRLGVGASARSRRSAGLRPRTDEADRVVPSICPFCAVGCGQRVHVRGEEILSIEGDPDSPISRGRLCPRGASSKDLVTGPGRERTVRYRPPHSAEWVDLPLDDAMGMIADRVVAERERHWQAEADGQRVNRTLAFGSLGGAALDNEENYLMKKLFTALGAIQIENQARI